MAKTRLTQTQKWFREYSSGLESSYRSSESFKHNLTMGEEREYQILDMLSLVLPQKLSIAKDVVICDSEDAQSSKFDGALIDYTLWPRLYNHRNTICAMIESIHTAIEIKSSLEKKESDDIFKKSATLRQMKSLTKLPLVTAFSYQCPNSNLSFFDFSTSFLSSQELSPSAICILNKNIFCLASVNGEKVTPVDEPSSDLIPVRVNSGEDTLLVYIYFLSRWATVKTESAHSFRRYSNNVFKEMRCFHFHTDFLNALKDSEANRLQARGCFLRKANDDISTLYKQARSKLGLNELKEDE